jgi:hypothetical protein
MMRYFGSQLVTVVVLSFSLACEQTVSSPPLPGPRIELRTWGMPGSARFTVCLLSDNRLTVDREALPSTDNGLTLRQEAVQLSRAESDELVQLARQADDFAEGCMSVGDGTSAAIRITDKFERLTRSCDMAREWPLGARTKAFLDRLNGYLSKEMQVY